MPPRKRIGDKLIEAGFITEEQLQAALGEQKKSGELLGAILFSLGYITQKQLFTVLSMSRSDSDEPAKLERASELNEEMEYLVRQSTSAFQTESTAGKKELDSPQSPLVTLVEKIIVSGINKGATDIHIGPDANDVRVRYRVDGLLSHGMFLPKDLLNPIVSRFKIIGHMNIAESRVPQDGSAEFYFRNKKLDLRLSTFPIVNGENVVVRILDKSNVIVGLENLGFSEADTEKIQQTLRLPYGMMLVTGPTGSGKTTTLYSCLSVINTVNRNIFTLEDPVEYQLPLARQSQVNVKAGLTFATGLRSILRQDPDVILVGEMRDTETAELSVRAALTGHLVFSTLHTNDAISSIARIVDMGIEPFLVASTVDAVVGQRLVRLLCTDCRVPLPKDDVLYSKLSADPATTPLFRAAGCPACSQTGFRGRTVIYEILKVTPEIRKMISRKDPIDEIRREAAKDGFRGMYEVGIEKVKSGLTTFEEVSSAARISV
ncbi:MAG: ATPase, T2SS/T4P/T4SS family [Nitrospiraceae bacterium]|nr:ATPase, T2SS/T4P/T4SS family [Nitrospiraceae bacterium]